MGVIFALVCVLCMMLMLYFSLTKQQPNKPASLIPKGWTIAVIDGVVQDVAPSQFDISKLKPRSFLKNGEKYISGEEMRKRAVEFKANRGLSDGGRMLAEQDKISVEFLDCYIPLPGTLLCDSIGHLYIPVLYCHGVLWRLGFDFFDNDWDDECLACSE